MGNLKNTVVMQMQDNKLKKQANLLKVAQDGPVIETKLTEKNFSVDDEVLKELSGFIEDIETIDFDIDENQSYIRWTVSADVKGDRVIINPIVVEGKIIGNVVAYTVGADKELKKENVEIPIDFERVAVDFYMENNVIVIRSVEMTKGFLSVTFWDKEI